MSFINLTKLSYFWLIYIKLAEMSGVAREIKKKSNIKEKNRMFLAKVTPRVFSKMSANSVQPFGQLQLTYI